MSLTKEDVAKYLRYEPETGDFFWVADTNPRGSSRVGDMAGGFNSFGHWQIRLFRKFYYGHQLAWLLTYGYIPEGIDHRNGVPSDNRLSNLRESNQSKNIANADFGPMRGIERHGRKWRVRITVRGQKRLEIGSFATLEQAVAARNEAYNKHFGEYSYFNRN